MLNRNVLLLTLICVSFFACDNKPKKVAVWDSYLDYDIITEEYSDTILKDKSCVDSQYVDFYYELEDPQEIVSPNHVELPANTGECLIVKHTVYTLSFNKETNLANWVAWSLTSERSNGNYSRTDDYRADDLLPSEHRIDEVAYKGSGYDRGHMCPAGDNKWSYQAMSESFLMSNMCPQAPELNQVWWEHLEEAERRWARQEGEIYICCGPIYDKQVEARYIGKEFKIRIPDAFFKVIVSLQHGKEKGIGFYYKNNDSRQTMECATLTIDQIEKLTGYDFFTALPDEIEARIETQNKLNAWR